MAEFYNDLNINKNKLKEAVIEPLSSAPSNPKQGQIYYNTTDNNIYRYDGTNWLTYQDALEVENGTAVNIDSAPVENSTNLVTSGGVYSAIQAGGGATEVFFIPIEENGSTVTSTVAFTEMEAAYNAGKLLVLTNQWGMIALISEYYEGDNETYAYMQFVYIQDSGASLGLSTYVVDSTDTWAVTVRFAETAIYATGILKRANGIITAAVAGTDYQAPLTIDTTPTDGNVTHVVSSDGIYDKILDRTKLYTASCSTAASTAAKIATLDDSSGFSLTAGTMVAVRFQYGNNATTPTLRVDGGTTGTAKTIAFSTAYNSRSTGNGSTYNTWGPYETVIFIYDGTYWVNTGSALGIYNAYNKANSIVVPSAADAAPLMDGTATVGTSTDYAREDHVHPSDTSKAAASHTHGDITNTGDITATAPTIASGDKIIINDESASKITNGPSFGTSTTTYLRNDGSWNTPTDNRDPGYGKIKPGTASTSTSAITANTTAAEASTYNETLTINPGNKWVSVAGSNSSTAGSDTFTIGHSAGLTAKTTYGSTSTTANADGGTITVTDVKYDEAGHITSSTDRTITLSQSDEIFIAEYGVTTYSELKTAYDAGKTIFLYCDWENSGEYNNYIPLVEFYDANDSSDNDFFTFILSYPNQIYTFYCSNTALASEAWYRSDSAYSPSAHASTATTYGVGNSSNYGHVKLSDSTSSTSSTTGGIAATPAAVKAAYDLANGKQASIGTTSGILKGNGSGVISAAVVGTDYQAPLPSQTGNSGKYLTTNGSALSWASVDALPSQSGNNGKYLTTNGTTASWGSINVPDITYGNTDLTPGVSSLATGSIYLFYE